MRAAVVLVVGIVLAGCTKDGGDPAAAVFGQKNDPQNLKILIQTVVAAAQDGRDATEKAKAASARGDTATAADLTSRAATEHRKAAILVRSLIPDADQAVKAMRDDAPAEFRKRYIEHITRVPDSDAEVASLFAHPSPDQTQINVHPATTEELIANDPKSIGYAEFPKGAHRLAAAVLRPGMTFYEVELVKPGQAKGTRYDLFYWDGSGWRMFGPAWKKLAGGGTDED